MGPQQLVLHLERNAFVSLRNLAPGLRILCREGALWITYDAEAFDIVLERGAAHVLRHGGAAVQALAPSRMVIAPAASAPRLSRWRGSLRWLHALQKAAV
jgi:hypothetical protein